jgi:hypothetical protein
MIDFKAAVRKAMDFLKVALEDESVRDIRLEEIELLENPAGPPVWSVTLSFLRDSERDQDSGPSIWYRALPGTDREAKVVRIKNDGEIIGMRQWVLP